MNRILKLKRILWILAVIIITIISFGEVVFAQSSEYLIKAAYLERFTRFIEWPQFSGNSEIDSTFNITVIGKNPFGKNFSKIFEGQKIKNRPVRIRYIDTVNEIKNTHLLFISNQKNEILKKILSIVNQKPILTIADAEGFAEKGIMINLVIRDNRIKFEINEKVFRDSPLSVSYLLLKEAILINPVGM